jgi:hypothetical protein
MLDGFADQFGDGVLGEGKRLAKSILCAALLKGFDIAVAHHQCPVVLRFYAANQSQRVGKLVANIVIFTRDASPCF